VAEVIRCECGYEARAADENTLLKAIQRHAWEAHRMPLSHEDALLLAFRAQLDETAPTTSHHKTTARRRKEKK
jgi:hypothetical protein